MKIDLHMHTSASDGDFTPTQVVNKAKRAGYKAIAITDHDTMGGIPEALRAGKKAKLTVIPGVEMSSVHQKHSVHIIGLNIDHTSKALKLRFKRYNSARIKRAHKIIKKLQKLGFKITYSAVRKRAAGVVTRAHIGEELIVHKQNRELLKEYTDKELTVSHVIQALIMPGKLAYVPYKKMTSNDDIKLIHKARGQAIFCHPWLLEEDYPRFPLTKFVKSLKRAGIDGMEILPSWQPSYRKKRKRYEHIARANNLLMSAGSDFHGSVHHQKFGSFQAPGWILDQFIEPNA